MGAELRHASIVRPDEIGEDRPAEGEGTAGKGFRGGRILEAVLGAAAWVSGGKYREWVQQVRPWYPAYVGRIVVTSMRSGIR